MPDTETTTGQHAESPEVTEDYRCLACGNTESFTGYDAHGWAGDEWQCENGVCDPDGTCECETLLVQPFTVLRNAAGEVEAIAYDCHEGGGSGAEISTYTRIDCRECGAVLWDSGEEPRTADQQGAEA